MTDDEEFGPMKSIRASGEPRPALSKADRKRRILYGYEMGQVKGRELYEARHLDNDRMVLNPETNLYETDLNEDLWRINWKAFGFPYCCVYLIAPDNGWPIKVGMSDNPASRLNALQTAHWKFLTVLGCWVCENKTAARKAEHVAHRTIQAAGKHLMGEWFDLRGDEALALVERAFVTNGIDAHRRLPIDAKFDAVFKHLDVELKRRQQHKSFFTGTDCR